MNLQPRHPQRPRTLTQKIHWFADFSLAYMPMFMLFILFLFSVWLVRSMPGENVEVTTSVPTHTVDYDFSAFTLRTYEGNGKIMSSMNGQQAQHFLDTRHTEVMSPYVYMYSKNQITTVQAKKALVNEEGTEVQLWGKTLLKRMDAQQKNEEMQITGEFLHFFKTTDVVLSHLPVVITKGKNTLKADAMRVDNLNQIYALKGRVSAKLAPNP